MINLKTEGWQDFKNNPPEYGTEVLAFHTEWIDEDFNPSGTRLGFLNGNDEFVSAKWWDYQDTYMTISKTECDNDMTFSEKTRNSTEPEKWFSLEQIQNLLNLKK